MNNSNSYIPNYVDFHIINKLNEVLPHFSINWKTAKLTQLRSIFFSFNSNMFIINPITNKMETIHPSYFDLKHFRKLRYFLLNNNYI